MLLANYVKFTEGCWVQIWFFLSVESTSNSIVAPPGQQSEIIFVGTGTSEGIPRVSCLTDPVKICSVWTTFCNTMLTFNPSIYHCSKKNVYMSFLLLFRYARKQRSQIARIGDSTQASWSVLMDLLGYAIFLSMLGSKFSFTFFPFFFAA